MTYCRDIYNHSDGTLHSNRPNYILPNNPRIFLCSNSHTCRRAHYHLKSHNLWPVRLRTHKFCLKNFWSLTHSLDLFLYHSRRVISRLWHSKASFWNWIWAFDHIRSEGEHPVSSHTNWWRQMKRNIHRFDSNKNVLACVLQNASI